ncbi:Dymeclin [Trichinella britovi]|uniref:Dymeclin n=1 Tax=Trichinella britovi TaxID=45882 RepID=A0A0V1D1M1_TRIBR|nr:Dymeclin [Trichinella britovi]
MGGQISSYSKIGDNLLVRQFVGDEPISVNDPFWNSFLSFNLSHPSLKSEWEMFEKSIDDSLKSLVHNTVDTGNFASLIQVFIRRASELRESSQCNDKLFFWQTNNAMFIIRTCCKFFSKNLTDEAVLRVFVTKVKEREDVESSADVSSENCLEEFVSSIIAILIDLPVNWITIKALMESLSCLLVLLSREVYEGNVISTAVAKMMLFGKCAIHAPLLTKTLLLLYSKHAEDACPLEKTDQFGGGSIFVGLANSLMELLQIDNNDKEKQIKSITLGDQALNVLLLLVSHNTPEGTIHPFRQALFSFINSQEQSMVTLPTTSVVCFKINFTELYDQICSRSGDKPSLLLLYFLLYKNVEFRNYVLSRVNLQNLILPILKVLHTSSQTDVDSNLGSQHLYLALIVIVILSEDDFFCKIIHETPAKGAEEWFVERSVRDLTLGGLAVLILVKIIQKNLFVYRDRYLQTNCLAALANMSSNFKELPSSVCQKLIDLLDRLSKRHARFVKRKELSMKYIVTEEVNNQVELFQDVTALEEAMRMFLEILNSALMHNLTHNIHLVYAILHQKDLFRDFEQHPMFQDLIWNITCVINFFSTRLREVGTETSVETILEDIKTAMFHWNPEGLKKFPDLKFKYVEDQNTEEFFVPYIWNIIYNKGGLYFDEETLIYVYHLWCLQTWSSELDDELSNVYAVICHQRVLIYHRCGNSRKKRSTEEFHCLSL